MVSPNRRGDRRVWTCNLHDGLTYRGSDSLNFTKVTSNAGISEEQLLLHLNGGVPGESAYVQPT